MLQKWVKLLKSNLGLTFTGTVVVSAGVISVFFGIPSGNSKPPIQSQQSNPINTTITGDGNIQGSPGNHSNQTTNVDKRQITNNVNSRQINTTNYTENDKRNQPTTNCNGGSYHKSVCGNVDTMVNH